MRVVCINDGDIDSDFLCPCKSMTIKEGEEYTVVYSWIQDGYCWYELSTDLNWGYDSERFAPLHSNIDEMELVNEKKKTILNPSIFLPKF